MTDLHKIWQNDAEQDSGGHNCHLKIKNSAISHNGAEWVILAVCHHLISSSHLLFFKNSCQTQLCTKFTHILNMVRLVCQLGFLELNFLTVGACENPFGIKIPKHLKHVNPIVKHFTVKSEVNGKDESQLFKNM